MSKKGLTYQTALSITPQSHPTGVRGLKQPHRLSYCGNPHVAPHRGAWIETTNIALDLVIELRRTPQGCVD